MKQIYSSLDYPTICDLYLKGYSTPQITTQIGNVNCSTIRQILIYCGIKRRTNSEAHQGKRPYQTLEKHHQWKGDNCKPKSGNQRARHMYPCPQGLERHHIDGNPLNNKPENIALVTRKGHQILDGRIERLNSFKAKAIEGRLCYCENLRENKKIPEAQQL